MYASDLLFAHCREYNYHDAGFASFIRCRFEEVNEVGRDLYWWVRLLSTFGASGASKQVEYFLDKSNLVALQCLKCRTLYHIFPRNSLDDRNLGLCFRINC